jgi:DNA-3-methyladenine glycosylase II
VRHKRLSAYTFTVEFPAPLDIPASLDIFRRTGDDGLDRWDGHVLVRTTRVADAVVPFIGTVVGTVDVPALVVTQPTPQPSSIPCGRCL